MSIKELREAVERGEDMHDRFCPMWHPHLCLEAEGAYYGSLDAAKELHNAVLPGWQWSLGENVHYGHCIVRVYRLINGGEDIEEHNAMSGALDQPDNPARAWLLAVLFALESKDNE